MIGIRGSHEDTIEIKSKVAKFCEGIKLKLSEEKTRITSLYKSKVLFLGVHLTRSNQNTYYIMKRHNRSKRQGLQLRFQAPIQKIIERLHRQGFMKKNQSSPKFI